MKKIILFTLFLICAFGNVVNAATAFVVKQIEVHGLQRISEETVITYLPIKVGDTLYPAQTVEIIKALYHTGFFDHIALGRHLNSLVINVVERPTIGQLKISGNSIIPKDKLTEVMRSVNVTEGRVFDRAVLEKIKQSLINQYFQLGRYNARVDITVSPMERNRVLVQIVISEGLVAKVRGINFIGNQAFSDKILNKQLALSTPGLFTFFTQKDRYSQEKLETSQENLKNYYLDHGYVRFRVKSSQVQITPDRKSIYITLVIEEGKPYQVEGFDVKGNLILPHDDIIKLIKVKSGNTFSRRSVISSEKAISELYGTKGYISAEITIDPKINDQTKQVFLTFNIAPGKKTYVRHIYFVENAKTNDIVLRREMEQMEASLANTNKLQQSKRRLMRLPYIKDAQMSIVPIENSDDQVDVAYKVTEEGAGTANFNVGYSQRDHLLVGAGINQKNFLGTGNTLGFNVSRSRGQQYYGINYSNPYFTPDGISRSMTLSFSKFDPKWAHSSLNYSTNQIGFTDVYSFPLIGDLGVFNRLQLGYGYENTKVVLQEDHEISEQIEDFIDRHGDHFQQFVLISGISRDSRDRSIYPTSGMLHSISANFYLPAQSHGLSYYTVDYNTRMYHSLPFNFVTIAKGEIGYGNSLTGPTNFPFYKNFYAGGIDSVRGYDANSLGPRDSNNKATGGNFLVNGSLGLVIPNHISENLRSSVFIDAGNVYDTFDNEQYDGTGSGPLRYSFGVELDWLTPMGLIDVSYARPINHKKGDHDDYFQFALGANFG